MSGSQASASPRAPRAHNAARQNGTASSSNNGGRGQRRNRGNRTHSENLATAQQGISGNVLQDPSLSESAVLSSEEVAVPVGQRQPKKHTRSQPSADRVLSSTNPPLADAEGGPGYSAATPAKTQGAYAGPTFHASPAPSALPIPKFLSKSVPPKTHTAPPTPPPEEGSDSGSSPSPSPSRGAPIPIPSRSHQNSPLDLLFKADRAERARNVNCSPPSVSFPNVPPGGGRPQPLKHDSFGSLNAPFPFELEANSQPTFSPPAANHRSVTAPSNIQQVDAVAPPRESDAIQDLMNRLSMSQNISNSSTPPRTGSYDPTLQHHSPSPFHDGRPSPFRSTSGPTTPAPSTQVQEDQKIVYGNQNLSSKFKAAKTDSVKRNSGLRTEITANSPVVPQGGFPPISLMNNDSRSMIGNALNNPGGPRRGSAPHIAPIPPYRGAPNNQNTRSPNRRSYQAHPNHAHTKPNGYANAAPGSPATIPKSTTAMAFIPSSVRAKPPPTPPRKVENDNAALEQNLKRMLNLGSGDTNGVR
ncbi:hypothetical protein P171DRAFT_261817 [Karstenula rhodostoma CBS 690.94]|uniref:Uncharacterized protein n=1 Tax=Karstenula rhodostoma CBS 690.94 TaxID=1392251 RepID=A0A9P4UET5_9PLEO|nr:hypothetical protein P171DRAFT_261817 [Karstenula rhodostoma CBS 690.94]